MIESEQYYYHAGVEFPRPPRLTFWSHHTRRSRAAAIREARRLTRGTNGRAVVEYWDRRHGLRPGDAEVVECCDYV
jgi:hypothetical protein